MSAAPKFRDKVAYLSSDWRVGEASGVEVVVSPAKVELGARARKFEREYGRRNLLLGDKSLKDW